MKFRFERVLWWMPCAYAAHICEEWFAGFPQFISDYMHGSAMSGATFIINNSVFMTILLTLSLWASRSHSRLSAFVLMSWASANLFWNFIFHLLYTVTTGHYSPGLVTATFFYYPIPFMVVAAGLRDGRLTLPGTISAFTIGGGMMYMVVWAFIYHFAL